jgi:hypothetical protein
MLRLLLALLADSSTGCGGDGNDDDDEALLLLLMFSSLLVDQASLALSICFLLFEKLVYDDIKRCLGRLKIELPSSFAANSSATISHIIEPSVAFLIVDPVRSVVSNTVSSAVRANGGVFRFKLVCGTKPSFVPTVPADEFVPSPLLRKISMAPAQ